MNIDVPLDLYKVFYTVVKTGNMSQAAKLLFISQPAVSMAIRQLESKLEGTLLIRNPKGVRPTSEGQVLFTYLDQALNIIAIGEKRYLEMLNLESGEIKIGASDIILNHFMLPFLEKFSQEHENINVKITNRTTGGTLSILRRGIIDIGFVNLPIESEDGLDVIKCAEINDILVGGRKYMSLTQQGLSIGELNKYPILLQENDSNSRKIIDNFALEQGVLLNPIFELGASDLILKFVSINWGLSFFPREFIVKDLQNRRLFEIPLDPPIPKRHIGLVKLRNVELSNAAKCFIRMFSAQQEED
jgi:DNA-binding transcriptional LysR family regulator